MTSSIPRSTIALAFLALALLALATAAPAALAAEPAPVAKRGTSYDHLCKGDVDVFCCTKPSSNPAQEGFCDPLKECTVSVAQQCVNRPLPSRPWGPDGECGGALDHQCNTCTQRDAQRNCIRYDECVVWLPATLSPSISNLSPCIRRP
jgi:hypothetical protein